MKPLEVVEGEGMGSNMGHGADTRNRALSAKRSLIITDVNSFEPAGKSQNLSARDLLGIIAAFTSMLLMAGFIYTVYLYRNGAPPKVCVTNACRRWASRIEEKMNPTVNPCVDFYEYSCGGWIQRRQKNMEDAGYYSSTSTQKRLEERIDETLYTLLNRTYAAQKRNIRKFRKVNGMIPKVFQFYESCMDETKIESRGGSPLLFYLSLLSMNQTGNIKVTEDKQQLSEHIARLARYGMPSLISLSIGPDLLDTSKHFIYVSQSTLMLPTQADYESQDLDSHATLKHLKKYIATLMKLSAQHLDKHLEKHPELQTKEEMANLTQYFESLKDGGTFSDTIIDRRADKLVEFEQKVAEAMVDADQVKSALEEYRPKPVEELIQEEETSQSIEWRALLDGFLQGKTTEDPMKVDEIAVTMPKYFSKLAELLANTQWEVLCDYLRVRFLFFSAGFLSSEYRKAETAFENSISGKTSETPRWKICCRRTNDALGFALGSAFIAKNWTGRSLEKAEAIIQQIKTSFDANIDSMSWMDDTEARKNAHEKISSMISNVGQPKALSEQKQIEGFYRDLNISVHDYFGNEIRSSWYQWLKAKNYLLWESARKDYGKHWQIMPASALSYYSRSRNAITFTAGILQPPLFHTTMPYYLTFGGIGTVIAHGLIHGFDEVGSKYDRTGTMQVGGRWSESVKKAFQQRAQCFEDQYSNYTVNISYNETFETLMVNGKQTLDENIADSAGLNNAYRAYSDFIVNKERGREESTLPFKHPNLKNLSSRQLFFISYAITHCDVARPKKLKRRTLKDWHAPPRYRVLGSLANSKDFATVFKCEEGAPMNPVSKCSLF